MSEHVEQAADHSRRRRNLALLAASVAIVVIGAIAGAVIFPKLPPRDPSEGHSGRRAVAMRPMPYIRGVCWEASGEIDSTHLDPLVRIHADWISQTPFGWQGAIDQPEIRVSYDAPRDAPRRHHGFWGESDEGIETTTRWARARGIKVLLKPHLWCRGGWSGEIAMKSAEDWAKWFAEYRAFILHYADLAERSGAEALAVGTELGGTVRHEKEWRAIIAEVRKRYHGALVYCANWSEDLEHTRFWDALDWIGVQAYYPLSPKRSPTTQELASAWRKPLADLDMASKIWGRPVVFTEVGYHSLDTAASRPWDMRLEGNLSLDTQARCYEALFEALADHPAVRGVFIWKWNPHYGDAGGDQDTEYTPQRKPAEAILAKAFEALERRTP